MSTSTTHIEANIARWRCELPEEIFDCRCWLLWQKKPKPRKPGKFDKIPFYTSGVKRHGINGCDADRAELVDFGDALIAYRRGRWDGIGIALLDDVQIWALDLDDCVTVTGALSELAQRTVSTGTYTEGSPSGSGVRALFAGKAGIDAKNHPAGVEIFNSRGFVTLTGDRLGARHREPGDGQHVGAAGDEHHAGNGHQVGDLHHQVDATFTVVLRPSFTS